jgi:predicted RNase H-like nuclease (RuvC/YqgF family)
VRFNDALWRTKECYKRQIYVGDEHLRLQEQHISELEEENGRLKQRIKRLEEAGDALKAAGYFGGWADAVNNWIKAKEDKL